MKIRAYKAKPIRIEMLPLIDIVFLLLVFFIYAMLSMAVHRGMPVVLPESKIAEIDPKPALSVTVQADGKTFVDKTPVPLDRLTAELRERTGGDSDREIMLFADRSVPYGELFRVLDRIRMAGLERISLQAEAEK